MATNPSRAGKLRIGDDWNAISIIAQSQSNPLKAVAEFVENSIDAGAQRVVITRGKERGQDFLTIADDGAGVMKDQAGLPDFHFVATHICDSVKRRMKNEGVDLQGEFGIGLLSFWTIGEAMTMTCAGDDGGVYEMTMQRGSSDYAVRKRRKTALFPANGTELRISPILPGLRQLSGERLDRYLASELRDRIRKNELDLVIRDRRARKELKVVPRSYDGLLLNQLPPVSTPSGEIYSELYVADPSPSRRVSLYRNGTRVFEDITEIEALKPEVWASGHFEGIIDAPFLTLTPGTRLGVIQDKHFMHAWFALRPLEDHLEGVLEEIRQAEAERASRKELDSIRRAFREASLALPNDEYDWFDVEADIIRRGKKAPTNPDSAETDDTAAESLPLPVSDNDSSANPRPAAEAEPEKAFYEYAGPLHAVNLSPASSTIAIGKRRYFRAVCRDRSKKTVENNLEFAWKVLEGPLVLEANNREIVGIRAEGEPALGRVEVQVTQGEITRTAEALITVTDTLMDDKRTGGGRNNSGLPGYTLQNAPGELWRSRYVAESNLIIVNNGHRDFVHASRRNKQRLRYLVQLFAKELVLHNFPGISPSELLERMVELSLYTEEHVR